VIKVLTGSRFMANYAKAMEPSSNELSLILNAPVAQLVEQWFEEPRVSGSNPFGSTISGR
jgi:hypothetical protein